MTSTMKSEPGAPPFSAWAAAGTCVSFAATCADGRSADGRRGGGAFSVVAARLGLMAVAAPAPATAMPVRKARRLTLGPAFLRAMDFLPMGHSPVIGTLDARSQKFASAI